MISEHESHPRDSQLLESAERHSKRLEKSPKNGAPTKVLGKQLLVSIKVDRRTSNDPTTKLEKGSTKQGRKTQAIGDLPRRLLSQTLK